MQELHDHSAAPPELVTVVTHARLVDAESREQIYWRRDGTGLAPGFYVVWWPPGAKCRKFNEDANFSGPFRSGQEAEEALVRATMRWRTRGPLRHGSPRGASPARDPHRAQR